MKLTPKCMVFGQKWASSLAESMFSKYNATGLGNNNLNLLFEKVEKEDQNKPSASRREKLIKIKAEINKN